MLWTPSKQFLEKPFEKEEEFEKAVIELARPLFGESRFYLDVKKKIGGKGKVTNIPDGYPQNQFVRFGWFRKAVLKRCKHLVTHRLNA
jgi:hypothetical protein